MENDSETKKAKGIKRCVIKRRLTFENYKDWLFNNKTITTKKSDHHNVYTEEHIVTTYPHGTNAFKVCESEMLGKIRV